MAAEDNLRPDQPAQPPESGSGASHGEGHRTIDTGGGAYVEGEVRTGGGDFAGRDVRKVSADTYIEQATLVASSQVGEGLGALQDMIQKSEAVKAAVLSFRTNFQATREQVGVLGDYKSLHDLLHQLQFHCYNPMIKAAPDFPQDSAACMNLMEYQLTLEDILDQARRVFESGNVSPQDSVWIDELDQARAALTQAVTKLEADLLGQALWMLDRLLATQPTRINIRLNDAARVLRLPSLIEALARIMENIDALEELEAEKVGQFQQGVSALSSFNEGLSQLVEDHDRWQSVDVELRRLEANPDEIHISWPYLEAKMAPLYRPGSESWSAPFLEATQTLEKAIAEGSPVQIQYEFQHFYTRARLRFFRVDRQLKNLCDELRKVGEPLVAVLRMIT